MGHSYKKHSKFNTKEWFPNLERELGLDYKLLKTAPPPPPEWEIFLGPHMPNTVNQVLFATILFHDLLDTNWFATTNFHEYKGL